MKAETETERHEIASHDKRLDQPASGTRFRQCWRQHLLHIALLVFLLVAMFWRVFLLGETLVDVATLNNQLPWGYDAGPSNYPYNRRDLTDMYVTRDYFVVAAYRDGELPLWNPYTMTGHPIYADGVTRTLSPFLLFYRFVDVPLGYSLGRITELILAAIFMYLFLIAIGVSARGALLGSLMFELSAHSLFHLTGLGWFGGLMWLPLILLFVHRAIAGQRFYPAVIAGVLFAAQFYCAYLPNQIYYAGAIVLYGLTLAHLLYGRYPRGRRVQLLGKNVLLIALTLSIAFALAATQWVPMLELLRYSNRKIVGADLGYIYLPPWYLLTLVFPNLFGEAYDTSTLTLFTALGVSHDHILYLGIAGLALLVFGLLWWRRAGGRAAEEGKAEGEQRGTGGGERGSRGGGEQESERARGTTTSERWAADDDTALLHVRLFGVMTLAALLVMVSTPLYVQVTRYIPILQVIRVAVRAGVIFHFGAAVLVAVGTDLVLRAPAGVLIAFAKLTRRFLYAAAGLVLAGTVAAFFVRAAGVTAEPGAHGRLAYLRKSAIVLAAQFSPPGLWLILPLLLLALIATLFQLTGRGRLRRPALVLSLAGLLIAELFCLGAQFNGTFDRSRVFQATQITSLLRRLPPGRVLVVPSDLESNRRTTSQDGKIIAPPNTLLPYQIPTVAGKNQQFPRWYRDFAALIEPQPNLSHVVFDQPRSPFFDLLNVRYVLTHAEAPRLAGYELLTTAEGISVYENKSALPQAFLVRNSIEVNSNSAALAALANPSFDARREVVIEANKPNDRETEEGSHSLDDGAPLASGSARIVEIGRNRLVIDSESAEDAWLVLSDNYYPGWRAAIDSDDAEIYRANATMRAVKVAAGRHVITFRFVPRAFWTSLYVSLGAAGAVALGLTIAALGGRRRRRR